MGRPITVGHPKDVGNTHFRNVDMKPLSCKESKLRTFYPKLLQTLFIFAAYLV